MNNQKNSPALLLDEVFTNFESLALALGWQQEFRQLEPGPLRVSALLVGHKHCQVVRLNFNRSFHQLGKPPPGYVAFGIPDVDQGKLAWAGKRLQAGSIVNLGVEGGLDMTSQGKFSGAILAFEKSRFLQSFETLGFQKSLLLELQKEPYWRPESDRLNETRDLLTAVFSACKDPDTQSLREYEDAFNSDFALSILQLISGSRQAEQPLLSSRRKLLEKALKALESDESNRLTVRSLCQAVGSSYSSLERVFFEAFGIPPKAYIRVRRLAAVQKELAQPDCKFTISDVAHKAGFWHMSAFSNDYRQQFGELPSETRSRAAHQ